MKLYKCKSCEYKFFKKYHYISSDCSKSATCFVLKNNGDLVAFVASISHPVKNGKKAKREHRLVVLPSYRGRGIGTKLSETMGQYEVSKGFRYFSKTSNKHLIRKRSKSKNWKFVCKTNARIKRKQVVGSVWAQKVREGTTYEYLSSNKITYKIPTT